MVPNSIIPWSIVNLKKKLPKSVHVSVPPFQSLFASFPSLLLSSMKMKCKLLQRVLSLQITSLLCYIHVNALILTNELKKLNAIEIEQVEPSVLIQYTTHKSFRIWEIDYFWFFSSFFFRCAVILSFSQAVIMLSSHPTPKENSHLLSPSLTLPTTGKLVSFEELKKIQVFQYIFHIP